MTEVLDRSDAGEGLDVLSADLSPKDRYKLLAGLVIPRPIALVTTVSEDGVVNAAPFSFFNLFSEEPPVVILGVNLRPEGATKDTTRNIQANGEYVIHVVSEDIAEAMNVCAVDFPAGMSEIELAGFTLKPSGSVAPPSIAEAPVALECRMTQIINLSPLRDLILGEVVRIRTRPGIVDPKRLYVDVAKYRPLARLFGNLYARLGDVFELKRQTYSEWVASKRPEPK